MDQLFCMRAYTRVVEQGSFARAADALEVSRPTVTNAVAQLEKRLRTRLLHRTTRRLSLTDEGRAYYQSCVQILGELAEAEDSLGTARASPRGHLRVSVPHSFMHLRFMPELPRFLARYPEVTLDIVLTDRAVNMVEEGIDCAVRATPIAPDATLVARHLMPNLRITCAAPRYLAARGTPRSVAELAHHDCVRFISPSTGRVVDWLFKGAEGEITFTPRGSVTVNSLEAAAAAAIAGIGIAHVPDSLAYQAILEGRLRPLLLELVLPHAPLYLVYPANRYLAAKVRAFADFMTEIYPAQGWWPKIVAAAAPQTLPIAVRRRARPSRRVTGSARPTAK
jgi:LysR family transcriptional regulator for bpeEF and oprC